jgi:hypothetical protein
MELIKSNKLEFIVFCSGGLVMIMEIVGSRVFAPYIGSSIYIWTGLIGIIMACLSLGYYYGGKLADKHSDAALLSTVLLFAGLYIFVSNTIKGVVLSFISTNFSDLRFSVILFEYDIVWSTKCVVGNGFTRCGQAPAV